MPAAKLVPVWAPLECASRVHIDSKEALAKTKMTNGTPYGLMDLTDTCTWKPLLRLVHTAGGRYRIPAFLALIFPSEKADRNPTNSPPIPTTPASA
ncbi:hypothetical protein DPX16_12982 [Anabarilius grahami]|uniref:Uncharacterized protein n=1 Tax=Anabarilius grahami TaxID=495550 RepID=A0A3N0XDM5_ANAGA|nr:hypothetical protein DPX16_12982 [Anabarilius grahami]